MSSLLRFRRRLSWQRMAVRSGVEDVQGVGTVGAERDHHPVPEVLVHRAPEAPHQGDELVEHRVELPGEVALGDLALRGLGEAAQVEEEHGRAHRVVEHLGRVPELVDAQAPDALSSRSARRRSPDELHPVAHPAHQLEALRPRDHVEERVDDLRRLAALRFRLDRGRRPGVGCPSSRGRPAGRCSTWAFIMTLTIRLCGLQVLVAGQARAGGGPRAPAARGRPRAAGAPSPAPGPAGSRRRPPRAGGSACCRGRNALKSSSPCSRSR